MDIRQIGELLDGMSSELPLCNAMSDLLKSLYNCDYVFIFIYNERWNRLIERVVRTNPSAPYLDFQPGFTALELVKSASRGPFILDPEDKATLGLGPGATVVVASTGDKQFLRGAVAIAKNTANTWGNEDLEKISIDVMLITRCYNLSVSLTESQQYANTIVESTDTAIFVISTEGEMIHFNRAAEGIYGFPAKWAIGKHYLELLSPKEKEITKRTFEYVMKTGKPFESSLYKFARVDGRVIYIGISIYPWLNAERNIIGAIVIVRDETETKHYQDQLLKSQRMAILGQIAAQVSHEVRGPLASIREYVSEAKAGNGRKERADAVLKQLDSIDSVIQELLQQYVKSQDGKLEFSAENGGRAGEWDESRPEPFEPGTRDRVKPAKAGGREKTRPENLDDTALDVGRSYGIIGQSPAMSEVIKIIQKVAAPNTTVLISGESGTGKSLLAQAIHWMSPRSQAPFVTVNCAVLTENLLESELFGHEKGAFTGAVSSKTGRFEMADRGTIFLDEISTLSLQTQAKLLRVIQDKRFERLGGRRILESDVRIIAATNENLEDAVAGGKFREDLYYRLNVFSVIMPPLRERVEDIPELADFFIQKFNQKMGKNIKGLSPEALNHLLRYFWPGNVRELENVIERSIIMADDNEITPYCLPAQFRTRAKESAVPEIGQTPAAPEKENVMSKLEKSIITEALAKTNGHRAKAAALLGISRRVLQYKLKKYGMTSR
ncbi:MAG: sigma 54-interacting transcriptional regulator [Firmicutes bacterium]|nr:sigma 54-interacting transcriptional regulator [Bacillota bacterium]